jgi:hypothetical protein
VGDGACSHPNSTRKMSPWTGRYRGSAPGMKGQGKNRHSQYSSCLVIAYFESAGVSEIVYSTDKKGECVVLDCALCIFLS